METRVDLTLQQISYAWRGKADGDRFERSLRDFIEGQRQYNTARGYAFSVLKLFEWLRTQKREIPTPRMITKADAGRYVDFLLSGQRLTEERLRHDPERGFDLAIYQVVQERPGIRIGDLREVLMRQPRFTQTFYDEGRARYGLVCEKQPDGFSRHLACLVERRTLQRTPSIAEIRSGRVDIGLPPQLARRIGIDYSVDEDVFQYFVPEVTADDHATTALTRVAALSAFWQYMMEADNTGQQPLIQFNIWKTKGLITSANAQKKTTRARKTPGMQLFLQLLVTTLTWAYQQAAPQAATALMYPGRVPLPHPLRPLIREPFSDARDRFALLLLAQTGLRVHELCRVTRGDVHGDPPILEVLGKGRKRRQIPLPPLVIRAAQQLTAKIEYLHGRRVRERGDDRLELLLDAAAPLVPAVQRWGKNASVSRVRALTGPAISMMLRRRAARGGIEPGTSDFARIHPHGLRHLFTKHAFESGTPVNVLQALLGHASGGQTLQYMEEHDPSKLVVQGFATPAQAQRGLTPPPMPPGWADEEPEESPVARQAPPPLTPAEVATDQQRYERAAAQQEVENDLIARARAAAVVAGEDEGEGWEDVEEEPSYADEGLSALLGLDEPEGAPEPPPEAETTVTSPLARVAPIPGAEAEALQQVYEYQWGEVGQRSRFKTATLGKAAEQYRRAGQQIPTEIADKLDEALPWNKRIAHQHIYIGKRSRLPWWAGGTGRLSPAMPILSADQIRRCVDDDQRDAICRGISQLWLDWMQSPEPGPTAAAALVRWLQLAIDVSEAVSRQLDEMGGTWIGFDEAGGGAFQLREHDPERVIEWFQKMAWNYRPRQREKHTPEVDEVPAWYADPDPVMALPAPERLELLEWLAVLTGQPIEASRSTLIAGTSHRVRDVVNFIQALCELDALNDQLWLAGHEEGARNAELQVLRRARDEAAKRVDDLTLGTGMRALGWEGAKTWMQGRIAQRRQGEGFRYRKPAYLALIDRLFGPATAGHPIVQYATSCDRGALMMHGAALKGEEKPIDYQELFRIDWRSETIRHELEFAEAFAKQFGSHSECVARRLARSLWELWRTQKEGSKERDFVQTMDKHELRYLLSTLASYLVPCPARLEVELQKRLGYPQKPLPVFETWQRSREERSFGLGEGESPEDQPQVVEYLRNPPRDWLVTPWWIARMI